MNRPIDAVGGTLARYGLVVVLAWFGVLKFMTYEAKGIEPLVSESPLMGWLYGVFSVTTFSALLGVFELVAAALLAVKPWWPRVSMLGSLLAIVAVHRHHQLPVHHAQASPRRPQEGSPHCRSRAGS